MHFVTAKGILSCHNGMNIYRGCQHGCIYCDARSDCYQMTHVFYDYSKLRWIVVNEIEAAALADGSEFGQTMDNLSRKFPNAGILMTLGSQGAWLRDGATDLRMGALHIENMVDTTAAGDTFLGYFLAGITAGADPETALQQATCASALAIQKPGAAQSVPNRDTLLAFWQDNRHLLPGIRG